MALSFLPRPPVKRSKTVIGYLPLEGATLEGFREEPGFLYVLRFYVLLSSHRLQVSMYKAVMMWL